MSFQFRSQWFRSLTGALAISLTLPLGLSSPALAQAPVELRMTVWTAAEPHLTLMRDIAANYTKLHPNVTVRFDTLVFDNFVTALTTQIAGGTAPDLTWLTEITADDFVEAGAIVPLGPTLKALPEYDLADFDPASIEAWSVDGEQYFYPLSTSPFAMFVNNDLIRKAGRPTPAELIAAGRWTWSEAMATAAAVAKSGNAQGLVVRDFNYTDWKKLGSIWTGWGADPWSADGKTCGFNSPQMLEAMTLIHDSIFKMGAMPEPGVSADFFAGEAAMTIAQISRANLLPKAGGFNWDLVPLPQGPNGKYSFVGLAGVGVLSQSKHQKEALDFLAFFSNKENVARLSQFFPPARRSLLKPENLAAANPKFTPEQLKSVVVDGIIGGKSLPGHTGFEQIFQTVRAGLDPLWVEDADVGAVMTEICAAIDPLLQR